MLTLGGSGTHPYGVTKNEGPKRVYIVRWRSLSGRKSKVYLWPNAARAYAQRLSGWRIGDIRLWSAAVGEWTEEEL